MSRRVTTNHDLARLRELAAAGVWLCEAARRIGIGEQAVRYWAARLGVVFAEYPQARWRLAPQPPYARPRA
jgi:hypothetical protein